MALKTIIESMNNAREQYELLRKTIATDAAKMIAETFGALLPTNCELKWRQYTPYFNDGDPCKFRVGDAYLTSGVPDPDADEDDGLYVSGHTIERYVDDKLPGLTKAAFAEIVDVWRSLPKDMMLDAFGDHAKVVVRSGGAHEVNEHEHD